MDYFNDESGIIQQDVDVFNNEQFIRNEVNGDELDLLQSNEQEPEMQIIATNADEQEPADITPKQQIEEIEEIQESPPSVPRIPERKRKFEEMEEENIQNDYSNDIGDVILRSPLSPKRMKLDPEIPTLARLSQVQMFSDIIFNVRGVTFHGIKAMFAIKSELLQKMMYPENGSFVKDINIDNISAVAFRFIKDYCYDLNPELDIINIVDVLTASKIYKIAAIEQQCNDFLNKIDNVNDLLTVLKAFGENGNEMEDKLNNVLANNVELLRSNGNEIIGSEIFKSLPFNAAKKIMESDDLGIKEEDLFNVAKTWDLNVFGDELKTIIRFGRMDIQYLHDNVKETGILNNSDLVSIYEKQLGLTDQCSFSAKERFITKVKKARGGSNKKKTKKKTATKSKRGRGKAKK